MPSSAVLTTRALTPAGEGQCDRSAFHSHRRGFGRLYASLPVRHQLHPAQVHLPSAGHFCKALHLDGRGPISGLQSHAAEGVPIRAGTNCAILCHLDHLAALHAGVGGQS